MKKNLFSIIIIALLLVDIAFTGFLAFSVIPAAQKTSELVTKICGAIDLELEDSDSAIGGLSINDIEVIDIEDELTINLKAGADGKDHIALLQVTLSLNKKHKDYESLSSGIKEKTSLVKDTIRSTISKFTKEDMVNNQEKVLKTLLDNIRGLVGSDVVVQVHFRKGIFQ